MKTWMLFVALLLSAVTTPAQAQVDVDLYIKKDKFAEIVLSPTGEYLAATIPLDDRTALAIMRRADNRLVGNFMLGPNTHVSSFAWASDERVVIAIAEKYGQLDRPQPTGELYAINADGSRAELLVGYRVRGNGLGTRIQPKKVEAVAAFLTDTLPSDDRHVLVDIWPLTGDDPFTRAERLDIKSGHRAQISRAPVKRAHFTTDTTGNVRFAQGAGTDNVNKLYYRDASAGEWRLLNDENVSGRIETPIGFSEDDAIAYLRVQHPSGPDAIVAWDVAADQRRQVLRDSVADPARIIYRNGTSVPVGAIVFAGTQKSLFFDEASPEARQYRSLEAAFGGDSIYITSSSRDGRLVLVETSSGSNPGDFFLFDTVTKKAQHVISRRDWFDPATAATVRPVALKARDGLDLHGYLTVPHGSDGRNLPMVVMPHGGPFDVFDGPSFASDTQLLAKAGYAVLQVNFRGSGNYGRAFIQAGAKQWGGAMQDDVTDATRWAITQGIADGSRICIYGGSYGGYAALMGVAREPGLYRCAAGYVGVYDLPLMFTTGDIQERGSGETYLKEWLGDPKRLAAVSPTQLAERIKVPVFLAAGGQDKRAPIRHSQLMEAALRKAGARVETLYYPTEGHGFYTLDHQREYYTRLLTFLATSLGRESAQGASP